MPPDRTLPVVLEMGEPVCGFDQRRAVARHRVREPRAVVRTAERDGLARRPRWGVDGDVRALLDVGDEPVPASADRAHHLLRPPVVTDDASHRLDAAHQRRLAHEAVAPDVVEQLGLRHHPVAVLEQINEEVEHLGLDRDGFARAPDLEAVGVDLDVPEDELHTVSLPRTCA